MVYGAPSTPLTKLLTLPPSIGNTYDHESYRRYVRDRASSNDPLETLLVDQDRPCHAVQAHRRRAQNTATSRRTKHVAKTHRQCEIQSWNRDKPASNQSCRLFQTPVSKIRR